MSQPIPPSVIDFWTEEATDRFQVRQGADSFAVVYETLPGADTIVVATFSALGALFTTEDAGAAAVALAQDLRIRYVNLAKNGSAR